jgi:hypothetical protein
MFGALLFVSLFHFQVVVGHLCTCAKSDRTTGQYEWYANHCHKVNILS